MAWIDRDARELHFWLLADEFTPVYAKLTANDGESEVVPIPDKERMKNLRRDYAGAVYEVSLRLSAYRFHLEEMRSLEQLELLDGSDKVIARALVMHGSDCGEDVKMETGENAAASPG